MSGPDERPTVVSASVNSATSGGETDWPSLLVSAKDPADSTAGFDKRDVRREVDLAEVAASPSSQPRVDAPERPDAESAVDMKKVGTALKRLMEQEVARDLLRDWKAERRRAAGGGSSWERVDLAQTVAALEGGDTLGERPTLLLRTDEAALLYPGRVSMFYGEPGSGKSFAALLAVRERLEAGERVLFLDFEDREQSIVSRLMAFGVAAQAIVERFDYRRPDEPIDQEALDEALTAGPSLVVIDGVNESMTLDGLSYTETDDIAAWGRRIVRPITEANVTAVLLDHVVKSKDGRGRWPIGGQHKLSLVDGAAFSVETGVPWNHDRSGYSDLTLRKDKHGGLPVNRDEKAARMRFEVAPGEPMVATFEPLGASLKAMSGDHSAAQEHALSRDPERTANALEVIAGSPDLSQSKFREAMGLGHEEARELLFALEAAERITIARGGKGRGWSIRCA